MCFEVKKGSRAKIAKKDIECWKVLNSDNSPLWGGNTHGVTVPYKPGVINPRIKICPLRGKIHEGYHSFKSASDICFACFRPRANQKECKFIIPAGTRYYENDEEYVSETIMML